ncbi:hypothetical protein PWT90_06022 [Aphanocladium album]|nr:hypothetical protein PWT90_06022 [Aphanocladium album]
MTQLSILRRLKKKFRNHSAPVVTNEHGRIYSSEHSASSEPLTNQRYGLFEFEICGTQLVPSGPERFPVDIIAVHGLGGDAFKTWTHQPTGKLWLRDFLPGFLPSCRVYTFGYPAKLHDVNVSAGVQDFARQLLSSVRNLMEDSSEAPRPIIFVCHSLGGIVCKQALVYAHDDPEVYGKLLQSTLGVVFLATPHRGSDTANMGNIFYTIANTSQAIMTAGLRPTAARTELLEYLTRNSKALQSLITSSRHRLKNLSIVTFYENKFTSPLSSLWSDSLPGFTPADVACVTLLNDADFVRYHQVLPKPVMGTCQWIHGDSKFLCWLGNGSNAMLWLTGHPGCGKTTLSSALAQHFKDGGEQSRAVLLYLCQNKNRQTDARDILRGLILQMVDRHRSMVAHVRRVYELHGQSMVQSFSHLWALFLRVLQDPKSGLVFVILDALDECERDSCLQLLGAISDLLSNSSYSVQKGVRVKFILTSRPLLHESYAVTKTFLEAKISIDEGQDGYVSDLRKFIRTRVDDLSKTRQFSSVMTEYLYESMSAKADRTFLWVHIVLSSLDQSLLTAKDDLKGIIDSIPDDLVAIYKRYLSSIAAEHHSTASRFLQLLLGSSRPLHLDELNIAFTINPTHIAVDDISQEMQGAISHTVQGILGPLIRVSEMQVSFVHQTVKEFLLTESVEQLGFPILRTVTEQSSALYLATACMHYLLLHDFQGDLFMANHSPTESLTMTSSSLDELPLGSIWDDDSDNPGLAGLYSELGMAFSDETCDSLASTFKLYSYAALHWAEHFAACEEVASVELQDAAKVLLDAKTPWCLNWLKFYRAKRMDMTDDDAFGDDAIVLSSQFNASSALNNLLHEHEPSQATKNRALYWAARLGHEKIVRVLLCAGADPNSHELEGQTALTVASEQGKAACVIALLADSRIDINIPGRGGRSAFSFACGGGYDGIVRELLQKSDCKADEPDYSGATPFFWAVGGGHSTTLSILTRETSININHRDKKGRTALSWAAGDGMADILKLLLKMRRINPNAVDNKGKSPLSWAAGHGQVNTVEILLRTDAIDKASVDRDMRSAISWASGRGHSEVLVRLLDAGCPGADTQDIDGWPPLLWAIATDSPDTVQVLIDSNQVQLNYRDRGGRSALDWAISYKHTNAVNALLRAGATRQPSPRSDNSLHKETVAQTAV